MSIYKNILIAYHPKVSGASEAAEQISHSLMTNHRNIKKTSVFDNIVQETINSQSIDLFIAIGGDGTMLHAGHLCAPQQVPILGIKMGHFGFLMEYGIEKWEEIKIKLNQNDFWLEKRMMLHCEHKRAHTTIKSWEVLNEVVVSRGISMHPIQMTTFVDEQLLTTYVADGLIVSTPTGSTAYALAAGGPILPPELRNILLVPLAPHLSVDRSLVLAEGASVRISVNNPYPAVVCADGHEPEDLKNDDQVIVTVSQHTTQFVRFQDPGYFYRNLTPHMNQNPSIGLITR